MYVCVCNAVTDRQIRAAAQRGARSLNDLSAELKVATCCGRCGDHARRILDEQGSPTWSPTTAQVALA